MQKKNRFCILREEHIITFYHCDFFSLRIFFKTLLYHIFLLSIDSVYKRSLGFDSAFLFKIVSIFNDVHILFVPYANVPTNKWFRSTNEKSNSHFKEFEVNSLTLRRGRTTEGSKKGYYEYRNPPWVNRSMLKTQWRRHQRDAILVMQQNNGVRPSFFNRITEGPPLVSKIKYQARNMRIRR